MFKSYSVEYSAACLCSNSSLEHSQHSFKQHKEKMLKIWKCFFLLTKSSEFCLWVKGTSVYKKQKYIKKRKKEMLSFLSPSRPYSALHSTPPPACRFC